MAGVSNRGVAWEEDVDRTLLEASANVAFDVDRLVAVVFEDFVFGFVFAFVAAFFAAVLFLALRLFFGGDLFINFSNLAVLFSFFCWARVDSVSASTFLWRRMSFSCCLFASPALSFSSFSCWSMV